jgi:hypothetical protein
MFASIWKLVWSYAQIIFLIREGGGVNKYPMVWLDGARPAPKICLWVENEMTKNNLTKLLSAGARALGANEHPRLTKLGQFIIMHSFLKYTKMTKLRKINWQISLDTTTFMAKTQSYKNFFCANYDNVSVTTFKLVRIYVYISVKIRECLRKGRISTVDLLVLTSSDLLL